ncbi:dihydrofolate reductase family protein [Pseudobacter ginsenosidimutans]|uniref:Dihydrofolate reductase n=1 Tax=Pseudobacter ginsenosidimutans TaxID=661488 RepID=A0A4Q7N418_9BACT|nr:dihydrofolate reductase family protein [Pseudobacter ginsenosidimutans]QEC44282.1 dihydrofolate reductase [Pseudobacter ginsenosidimutans]RZS75743.1 dihydrofolate reductase [Pseudobacter ginsenosidimutans]
MRSIIVCNWLSLDGFIAGPKGETDWFSWSDEIAVFYKQIHSTVDTILFGRKTYEIMAAYWPTAQSAAEDPSIIAHMNESKKIVYSETLATTNWNNTEVEKEIDPAAVKELKEQPGKDIIVYGSGSVVGRLISLNLVDHFYIMISPILLGNGKQLAAGLDHFVKLNKPEVFPFAAGGVLLKYSIS